MRKEYQGRIEKQKQTQIKDQHQSAPTDILVSTWHTHEGFTSQLVIRAVTVTVSHQNGVGRDKLCHLSELPKRWWSSFNAGTAMYFTVLMEVSIESMVCLSALLNRICGTSFNLCLEFLIRLLLRSENKSFF